MICTQRTYSIIMNAAWGASLPNNSLKYLAWDKQTKIRLRYTQLGSILQIQCLWKKLILYRYYYSLKYKMYI